MMQQELCCSAYGAVLLGLSRGAIRVQKLCFYGDKSITFIGKKQCCCDTQTMLLWE